MKKKLHPDTVDASSSGRSARGRRGSLERAYFDGGVMPYVVLIGAITIFGIELTANAMRGDGTVSLLHWLIVGSLEVTLIVFLVRNVFRRVTQSFRTRR